MTQLIGPPVTTYPPFQPNGTTSVNIYADDPLIINNNNSPHNTDYVIPNGKVLRIQAIFISSSRDSSGKGSRVEVIYDNGTEYVIARVHVNSGNPYSRFFADISKSRNGTDLHGDGSDKIVVRRTKLTSGSDHEVDVEIQAYLEDIPS